MTEPVSGAGIRLDAVTKQYGRHQALAELTLEVFPGEAVVLRGASGSGKSTAIALASSLVRLARGGWTRCCSARKQRAVLVRDTPPRRVGGVIMRASRSVGAGGGFLLAMILIGLRHNGDGLLAQMKNQSEKHLPSCAAHNKL